MSDSTGNQSHGQPDQPDATGGQQPAGYPPPTGQPAPPYGQQPSAPSPYEQPAPPYGQPGPGQPSFTEQYGQPTYGQPTYGQPAYGPSGVSDRRPGTVTTAGVLTLVFAGLSLLLFGLVLIAFLVARDMVVDEMARTPGFESIEPTDVVTGVVVLMVGFVVWCVVAMVLAVFAMRRSNGARIGLVISASLAATVSLLSIQSLLSGLPLIASVATIVCLFAGGANAWYAGRHGGPPTGGWQSSPVA